jgi:hypothetical protein
MICGCLAIARGAKLKEKRLALMHQDLRGRAETMSTARCIGRKQGQVIPQYLIAREMAFGFTVGTQHTIHTLPARTPAAVSE